MDKHVYGGVLKARFDAIKRRKGKFGVETIIEEVKKRGYYYPEVPKKIKTKTKYPIEYLLAILQVYENAYGRKHFRLMCRVAAKKEGIFGFFVRWAFSPHDLIEKACDYWPQFYDFGRLEGEKLSKSSARMVGYDISVDPLFCRSHGYFCEGVFQTLNLELDIEHTKCVHANDDPYCEWILNWG